MALGAVVVAACSGRNKGQQAADTSTQSAGGVATGAGAAQPAALGYEVTDEGYRRWVAAQRVLDTLSGLPAPPRLDPDRLTEQDIARAVTYLERDPRVRQALQQAGLSARDYVMTTVALDQALVMSTAPAHPRYRGLPQRNVDVVAQHRTDVERELTEGRYRIAEHATDTARMDTLQPIASAGVVDIRGTDSVIADSVPHVSGDTATGAGPTDGVRGVIAAGSTVTLRAESRVCTSNHKVGDRFTASVVSPVVGSNGAVIPAGATVILTLTQLKRSRNVKEPIVIGLAVNSVAVGADIYPVQATVASAEVERVPSKPKGDLGKVLGGTAAGAIAGQVVTQSAAGTVAGGAAGGAAGAAAAAATADYDGCIPNGGRIRVTLRNPLLVRV
jgi:hypothetical protein